MIERIAIIMGGPSVQRYDLSSLHKHAFVIAVNDACLHFKHHALCSMDGRWLKNRVDVYKNSNIPVLVRRSSYNKHVGVIYPNIHMFDCNHLASQLYGGTELAAPNSGFMAFDIAVRMAERLSVKEILVFGSDYKKEGSQSYFYPMYDWKKSMFTGKFHAWAAAFDKSESYCTNRGLKVYICSDNTLIQNYERMTPDAFGDYIRRIQTGK